MNEHHHRHHRRGPFEHHPLDPTRSPFDQPPREHPRRPRDRSELGEAPEVVSATSLESTNDLTRDVAFYLHRLGVLAERRDTPADMRIIALTSQQTRKLDEVGNIPSRSIGIINPTSITIYLGLGGLPATAQGRAPSVPGSSHAVFPVSAEDLEVGAAAADLAAGDAVVYLFRYPSVQPAYFSLI